MQPAAWDGWPADWSTSWGGAPAKLTDTAWTCLDLNASVLSTMPPYLVGASPNLDAEWLTNPNPDLYTSWEEFAKSLFWDYQACGEAFVIVDARYSTGYPARFHVVAAPYVEVDIVAGLRRYRVGNLDVTGDMLHIRYKSTVGDAHGHGPLEAGAARLVAADVIARYGASLPASGGIPTSVLEHPDELTPEQAAELQAQWVQARRSAIGEPAVLSGGVTWRATQLSPKELALLELETFNESRIAVMLGVPPFLVGLPSGGDSMTYSNVSSIFDYHWRAGLRPKAQTVMAALSGWLLPRGTTVEVNRDAYVQPDPYTRAQTAQLLHGIVDPVTKQEALSVAEIRAAERFDGAAPNAPAGVMRG